MFLVSLLYKHLRFRPTCCTIRSLIRLTASWCRRPNPFSNLQEFDVLVFFPYKRPNTREFHENRPSDHYILDMTANEFSYVCCTFPRQPGRCPVWQFPTQCCTAVAIREFRTKKETYTFHL
jgi:hypothetical protein